MARPKDQTWTRLWQAAVYSMKGLAAAFKHEQAFRQEIYVLCLIVPAGWWLGGNGVERGLLIGSWVLVIIVELLNSAIEAAVDRISSEHHELARRAKDMGSAAVLGSILLAGVLWLLIVIPA